MKAIITLCLSLLCTITIAQNKVEGVVTDQDGSPIFYATVALFNPSDSTVVKATSTDDDGRYSLEGISDGTYYLTCSMLSFTTQTVQDVVLSGAGLSKNFTLGEDTNLLSTVEITAKVPLMEQRADKLIVNVADNITNTSGSLLDVMKKVPGMLVINDRLSMAGSGSPTILLNGKTTQYMDVQALLRDMPGDNIQKVEIIHQPGAEFEAAGSGPIINIILKKNSLFGTNGSVSLGVGRGELWDYNTGLNLSHYAGKLNVFGGLGYSQNAYIDRLFLNRRLTGIDPSVNGTYVQTNSDIAQPKAYRGNLRLDYDVSDRHRIGIEGKMYNSSNEYTANNSTTASITDEGFQSYKLTTSNDINREWSYRSINPYYIFEIDTSDQKLELDVSFANYQQERLNTLNTSSNLGGGVDRQRYTQPGDTKIFATTLDYTKPFSKHITFKAGVKFSEANLDNNLISEYQSGDQWLNNTNQSNHYLFDETIYAGYGKIRWKAGDWSGTAGLRYEESLSEGESLTIDSTLSRKINKFFPSFSLSNNFMGPLTATATYSYRIDRPRYSTLNPFVYYLDPFTYQRGNQNLRPELTHSAKFTISADGQPFINIEYKQSNDAIVEVTNQEKNSQEVFKTDINFDKQTQLSGSLFFPLSIIPGVDGYGGVIVSQNKYNSLYGDGVFEREAVTTTAFFQAEFDLPWDVDAQLGGWYNSGEQEGIFRSEYLYGTNFGMSKKFLDSKLKVSLGVEDFLNRFFHAKVDYEQDMDVISEWQAPVVSARAVYKFGNQHLKSKKKTKGSASDEIRRVNQG